MSTHPILRRFALGTAAAAGMSVLAAQADAQSRRSEAALVRVEVVAAPAPPITRSAGAGWSIDPSGAASWKAEVEVDGDAVLSLPRDGASAGAPVAELVVRREGPKRVAELTLRSASRAEAAAAEAPVTLRIER